MKVNNTTKNKKYKNRIKYTLIALLFLITTLSALYLSKDILFLNNDQTENLLIDLNPLTDEQKQTGKDIKNQNNQTSTNNDLGVSLSSITTDNDVVRIRTIISGALSNSGTCSLKLTQGNLIYETSSATFAMTSYSTCQGFDVNKSELGTGEWQIQLSVTVGDKTSLITNTTVLE